MRARACLLSCAAGSELLSWGPTHPTLDSYSHNQYDFLAKAACVHALGVQT